IGLMMANELIVYRFHTESQMSIHEGKAVNYSQDIRQIELAVIDPSYSKDDEKVVAIPQSYLVSGRPIDHEALPFRAEVVRFLPNASDHRAVRSGEKNLATAGAGLNSTVDLVRPGAGADSNARVDMPAAYIRLTDKASGKDLGTYLVGLFQSMRGLSERVTIDGKPYNLSLRHKRLYKPYTIQLIDVRADKYLGTNMARNYSSDIRLIDPSRHVDREVHIWMNNPLRYEGETFYQNQFQVDATTGAEVTGLQIVANAGWMIPYVACMIVATGLLAHFSIVLLRYLGRRARMGDVAPMVEASSPKRHRRAQAVSPHGGGLAERLFPWAVALIAAIWLVGKGVPHAATPGTFDLDAFGRLPVVYEGRVKPVDTVARNSLRILSGRQTFTDDAGRRQPAIRWLLDVIAHTRAADRHKVFRIESLELLDTLGLQQRPGYRFALDEFRERVDEIDRQAGLAHSLDTRQLSIYQKKVLQLGRKLRLYWRLREAYAFPSLRADHVEEDLQAAKRRRTNLAGYSLPHAIPPAADAPDAAWEPYTHAVVTAWARSMVGQKPHPATQAMATMLTSYAKGNPDAFNRALPQYQTYLETNTPKDLNLNKTRFESFFNHFQPFYYAAVLYLFAFLLAATSWLGWSRPLNRAAFYLIVVTFAVHTFALVARIYISGRPPVTNIYSSAIFLGWGCVVLGLILEVLYRLGVGNIIAAVAGFLTLLIAHFLSGDGDTFVVLQAVLDTQFWLATHVTCITFGYSTTYLAGILGVLYIVRGVLTPSLTPRLGKEIARMIYGTLCFALFFSFVGTVLGGLWADDSWGRFWGWDPKENGALIIVLWNALVLHARWDGLVRDRGLAVLAVGGNIATSWSWFGVNELGAGLHSYGFTDGVALTLVLFVISQLSIMAVGSIPVEQWWSFRRSAASRAAT
ncbi:MAG: cytochrome c biogenesis protein CcsA, partial [Pirellulales bacterium]